MQFHSSNHMPFVFDPKDLKAFDAHLLQFAFVGGYKIGAADAAAFKQMCGVNTSEFVNVKRWLKHMSSYTMAEIQAFGTSCSTCCGGTCSAKKADKGEEVDLFGESSEDSEDLKKYEEAAKAVEAKRAAKAAAEAAAGKVKKECINKSMCVFHLKPYGDETDLKPILAAIPEKIKMEGLSWGKGELIEGAFSGIFVIAMPCIIVDDLVSTEDLAEAMVAAFEDDIQSCDLIVMNKHDGK